MLPSQIKRLLELLRTQLNSINGTLKEQESAIRDASIRAEEQWHEPPRIIASAISELRIPKEERDKSATDQENRHRQNLTQQRWLTGFTALAFLAAAIYAGIAAKQLGEMRRTNDLTKQALDKSDQSLKDTLAKMQGQIDATNRLYGEAQKQTKQSRRLADESSRSNANFVQSERPWIGIQIQVVDLEIDKHPNVSANFLNSGKRPAKIDYSFEKSGFFPSFPFNADADTVQPGSTSILVPGDRLAESAKATGRAIRQEDMIQTEGEHPFWTYYAWAKVQYRDLETNGVHFTRVCIEFVPKLKTANDNGFRNCPEYNEAD